MEPTELARRRRLIEEDAQKRYGLTIDSWVKGEGEDSIIAMVGLWRVMDDDEDRGLYGGDEGELHVEVVGAPEYHNERVHYGFKPVDMDEVGAEVVPFEDIEPL